MPRRLAFANNYPIPRVHQRSFDMPPLIDLTGQRFGRLVVVARAGSLCGLATWLCCCDCGEKKVVLGQSLRRGESQSCGCLQREIMSKRDRRTHGLTVGGARPPEYRSWMAMLSRCRNPNATGFHNYGGRGISVCARWSDGENGLSGYECFVSDMGLRPDNSYTLDRYPDPDGNYEPGNCRWATKQEQRLNQRERK